MRQRPVSTLIFGILNICWALFKLAGPLLMLAMSHVKHPSNPALDSLNSDPSYAALLRFGSIAGVVLGLALLIFGIGLLLLKNWARLGSIIYSIIDIVLAVVMSMLTWPYTKRAMDNIPNVSPGMMQGFAMVGLVIGLMFGVGYPALLIFFMTRPNVIEACEPELPALETVPAPPPPPV